METSRLMSYRGWTRATALRAGAVIAGVALAGSVAFAQTVKPIGTFASWTAFTHGEGGSLLCFATAQPTKQEPAGAKRSPAFVYVSSWPKDGVKAEVSVRVGYPLKGGSEVTMAIGNASFKLFAHGDRAYIADAGEELKLIEAMRRGSTMTIVGTSERGTTTTDTYSLAGVTQALHAVTTSCK